MVRSTLLCTCLVLVGFASPAPGQEKAFLGKTANGWIQQLKTSTDAHQRRNAAYALGKMSTSAWSVFGDIKLAFTREKDGKVRDALLFALGDICRDIGDSASKDVELEKLFIGALKDSDPLVRRSAAYGLGSMRSNSEAALAALDAALGDDNPVVRQNVAWALAPFEVAGLPSLRKALHDSDSLVKRDAASALLRISNGDKVHELLKDLLPLCRDTNSETRRAVLNVLIRIVDPGDKDAIPSLKWALDDRDLENRRNAALALTNIGGEETVAALPILLDAIHTGDSESRLQAVLAIRNIGPKAKGAMEDLKRLLSSDPDAKIRLNAAVALAGLGPNAEPAIPLLLRKLQDPAETSALRVRCAMTLNSIGPVPMAAKIVPELLALLADPRQDVKVRERIPWALRVHRTNLRDMDGTLQTFAAVCKEVRTRENRMLRYDCSYMLGFVWRAEAPEVALDVLTEYLKDDTVLIFERVNVSVGATGQETKGADSTVKDVGNADGRSMTCDALMLMGPGRYAQRPEIMKQLKVLSDTSTDLALKKKSTELLRLAAK